MKGLYGGLILSFLCFNIALAQTAGDYRSLGGPWNQASSWERFDGAEWIPAGLPPTDSDGIISIQASTAIDVTSAVTADQLVVDSDGMLNIQSGGYLTVLNDAGGDDLIITQGDGFFTNDGFCNVLDGGVLENRGQISSTFTNLQVDGIFIHFQNGGTLPLGAWNQNSWVEIQGITNIRPSGLSSQTFYNFRWNSSQTATISLLGELTNITNDFEITNTGSGATTALVLSTNTSGTLNIGGNLIITGNGALGIIQSNSYTVNVNGNVTISANNTKSLPLNMNSTGALVTMNVGGNLEKSNSGGISLVNTVSTTATASSRLDIDGDFTLNGGTVTMANGSQAASLAVGTIVIGGDLTINGGSFTEISAGTNSRGVISFDGNAAQQFTSAVASPFANTINFSILNPAILNISEASYFMGQGSFTMEAGATLGVASVDGLVAGTSSGNIRVAGTRTYPANGNIIYNGTSAQNLGNEWSNTGALNGIAVNLEIANTNAAGVTNNITGSTSLVGDLTLTSSSLNIGNSNTLIIQSNFTSNGGTIGGLSTSNLTFAGSGTITGALNFAAGAQNLNNLTIARDATILLGTPLTLAGVLSFTEPGELRFYNQTLTLNGDLTQSGSGTSGGLESNSASNLVIGGTGTLSGLPFVNSSQINDITFGRSSGGTYTLASPLLVNGDLFLNAGTLTHNSGLTMGTNSTLHKGGGTFTISSISPSAETSYNVKYTGSGDTGVELPLSTTALNDLTIESGGVVTLTSDITVNGDLRLNGGTFAVGTGTNARNITMAGVSKLWLKAGGAFTPGGSTVFISGSISVQGTNPQFGNLTTRAGSSLTLISNNIQVSGNLQLSSTSTFITTGKTITFNGAGTTAQTITPGGKTFDNIVVNRTGTGTVNILPTLNLLGTLDIRSATNVQSNGNLVLVSTSDGTTGNASILKIPDGASVTGNVVVQRYMSGEGKIFRDISSPVQSATVQQIIDSQIPVTGWPGAYPCAGCLNNNPSMFHYNETVGGVQDNGFVAASSASQVLTPGRGYSVYVRETSSPRTIALTGPINTGAISLGVSYTDSGHPDDGWNFVGNPYPGTIDWDDSEGWDKVNIQGNMISIWDAGAGQYKTWNGSVGSTSGLIAKGQGFWIKTNRNLGINPSLQVDEDAKAGTTGAFYRKKSEPLHYVELILAGTNVEDRAYIQMIKGSTLGFDNMDGMKFPYNGFSLALMLDENKRVAINAVGEIIESARIPLQVSAVSPGDYSFSLNVVGDFGGSRLSIYDTYSDTYNPIEPGGTYTFNVTENPLSKASDRFVLVFGDVAQENASPVTLFPNPVEDKLTVNVISEIEPEAEVFNNLGQSIGYLTWTQAAAHKWKGNGNFENHPYGVYFVRVRTDQGVQVVKFLKN